MIDTIGYIVIVTAIAFIGAAVFRPLRERDQATGRADADDMARTEQRIEEIERASRRER